MTNSKQESPFWSTIGKIGVLIGLLWAGIQIFNNFFNKSDYIIEVEGRHYLYQSSPIHKDAYILKEKYVIAYQNTDKRDIKLLPDNIDFLVSLYSRNSYAYDGISLKINRDLNSSFSDDDYKSLWSISIKNDGSKPLEELTLEIPFKGSYQITYPDGTVHKGTFNDRIPIGNLKPSYLISVLCWSDQEPFYTTDAEEKSRVTHKNGWDAISYSYEVTGFTASLLRSNFLGPTISVIVTLLVFISILKPFSNKPTKTKDKTDIIKPEEAIKPSDEL